LSWTAVALSLKITGEKKYVLSFVTIRIVIFFDRCSLGGTIDLPILHLSFDTFWSLKVIYKTSEEVVDVWVSGVKVLIWI